MQRLKSEISGGDIRIAHPRLATSSELNGAQAAAFAVCSAAAAAAAVAAKVLRQ